MAKSTSITVRLSASDRQKLDTDSKVAGMSASDYLRALIQGTTPTAGKDRQEYAKAFCHLRIVLAEQGLSENAEINAEMQSLCQTLLS